MTRLVQTLLTTSARQRGLTNMSRNGKAPIVYGGYEPKREQQVVFNLAVVALVFWVLALAALGGWVLSWI